jgi:hypothetical protein
MAARIFFMGRMYHAEPASGRAEIDLASREERGWRSES